MFSKKVTVKNVESIPWVEKYRPKNMSEVAEQDEVIRVLRNAVETDNLPHLLFYGPPGTGKTSTILALAREFFGTDLMKSRVLELNASDERGIKVVREKIKDFAQLSVSSSDNNTKVPPYKLIILDEADAMTSDAQSALRRIMELYSKNTRFCIICNYVSRIIEPIVSRCARFRFKPLGENVTISHLSQICKKEHVNITDDTLRALHSFTEGDLRRSIMLLQSAHMVRKQSGQIITAQDISELAGHVPEEVLQRLLKVCADKKSTFTDLEAVVRNTVCAGYSAHQIIHQLVDLIAMSDPLKDILVISDIQKAQLATRLADIDKKLSGGADEHLQILDLAFYMKTIVSLKA